MQLLEQPLKMPRPHGARRRRQRIAEAGNELLELLDLQHVGLLVDAIDARHAAPFDVGRDGLVGEQHELFDQLVRDVALGLDDRLDLAGVVDDDFGFRQIEIDRAAPLAAPVQDVKQLAHQLELRHEVAVLLHQLRRLGR